MYKNQGLSLYAYIKTFFILYYIERFFFFFKNFYIERLLLELYHFYKNLLFSHIYYTSYIIDKKFVKNNYEAFVSQNLFVIYFPMWC